MRRGLASIRWAWTASLGAALLLGCPTDHDDDDSAASIDLDVDSDRDGTIDGSAAEEDAEETAPGAIVLADVDDDNGNGTVDGKCVGPCSEENEWAYAVLQAAGLADLPEDAVVEFTLDGDAEEFRALVEEETILGINYERDWVATSAEIEGLAGSEGLELTLEGLDFRTEATIGVRVEGADGVVVDDEILLSTPPFMMFNHLDPAVEIWVMSQGTTNAQMINGIKEALGSEVVVEVGVQQYGWDVWIQDELEFGYQQSPYGTMPLVLDSARNGGLDPLPETLMLGPDFGWLKRGDAAANSLDSFGNLECSPPLTVDGVDYPFGRIYYGGKEGGLRMIPEIRSFLDDQEVQSPVEIDSTWLTVGHIDEFMTFIPDPGSDKGFKVLFTDWSITRPLLESIDPRMALPRFDNGHDAGTVGELLEGPLLSYNDDLWDLYMLPAKQQAIEAFGLTEDDFVNIPGVFLEEWGAALALVPGMANLIVYDHHLLIADPFFRTFDEDLNGDGALQFVEDLDGDGRLDTDEDVNGNGVLDDGEDLDGDGVLDTEEDANGNYWLDDGEDLNGDGLLNTYRDPFIAAFRDVAPDGLELTFLDDWEGYHLWWGEVHCGTNVLREPRSDLFWWEVD